MKYIEWEEQEGNLGRVIFTHNFPEMLTVEDMKNGLLVDNILEPEKTEKIPQLYIDLDTKKMFYKYYDKTETTEQSMEERIAALEIAMANTLGM